MFGCSVLAQLSTIRNFTAGYFAAISGTRSLNSKPTVMTTFAPARAAASTFWRCVVGSVLSNTFASAPSVRATASVPTRPSFRKSLTPIGLGET